MPLRHAPSPRLPSLPCGVRLGLLGLLGLLAVAPPAAADGFSCGNRVVTEGMEAREVRAVCGEPAQITTKSLLRRPVVWRHGRPYYAGEGYVDVIVETWLYNFGTTRLMRKLRFEDGVLQDVETLGYGYNE